MELCDGGDLLHQVKQEAGRGLEVGRATFPIQRAPVLLTSLHPSVSVQTLKDSKLYSEQEIADVARQAAECLRHCHSLGGARKGAMIRGHLRVAEAFGRGWRGCQLVTLLQAWPTGT